MVVGFDCMGAEYSSYGIMQSNFTCIFYCIMMLPVYTVHRSFTTSGVPQYEAVTISGAFRPTECNELERLTGVTLEPMPTNRETALRLKVSAGCKLLHTRFFLSPLPMSNLEFEAWLSVSKKDVYGDWCEYINSVGIVELWETTGLTRDVAMRLNTSDATEAFREYALAAFEDSRDFSNSGL